MSEVFKAFNVDSPGLLRYFWSIGSHKMLAMGDYVCVDCGHGECPLQILDIILPSAKKHQQPEKQGAEQRI